MSGTFSPITIKRVNQHVERVYVNDIVRYWLKPATNGAKHPPVTGINIVDSTGRKWWHENRDLAIDTILWWEWLGGKIHAN